MVVEEWEQRLRLPTVICTTLFLSLQLLSSQCEFRLCHVVCVCVLDVVSWEREVSDDMLSVRPEWQHTCSTHTHPTHTHLCVLFHRFLFPQPP